MPIIGTIDDKRAAQMIETAMQGVAASAAKVVIVDVTGVKSVDTSVASRLMSLAHAVGLLGSRAILTGLRPAVAQSLVALGVDLGAIETRGCTRNCTRNCARKYTRNCTREARAQPACAATPGTSA
jgi:anti-anti-sigma regulatory factor